MVPSTTLVLWGVLATKALQLKEFLGTLGAVPFLWISTLFSNSPFTLSLAEAEVREFFWSAAWLVFFAVCLYSLYSFLISEVFIFEKFSALFWKRVFKSLWTGLGLGGKVLVSFGWVRTGWAGCECSIVKVWRVELFVSFSVTIAVVIAGTYKEFFEKGLQTRILLVVEYLIQG